RVGLVRDVGVQIGVLVAVVVALESRSLDRPCWTHPRAAGAHRPIGAGDGDEGGEHQCRAQEDLALHGITSTIGVNGGSTRLRASRFPFADPWGRASAERGRSVS